MNEPWQWAESDILNLIRDREQESLILDYKGSDALQKTESRKNELSKDVSAFANSAGGILVYGVEENGHIPVGIDAGCDPNDISKEWLEQVINSRIHRRIDGIVINPIALSGEKYGRVIYVVVVPPSLRAPHMASDNRFYKRFNFQSVAMEEYEVRDVSRRIDTPELDISIEIRSMARAKKVLSLRGDFWLAFAIEIFVGNRSEVPGENCFFAFYWDRRLTVQRRGTKKSQPAITPLPNEIRFEGHEVPVFSGSIHWRPMERPLIWPGIRHFLTAIPIRILNPSGPYYFFWEAQAPYMEKKLGGFVLNLDANHSGTSVINVDWRKTSRNV